VRSIARSAEERREEFSLTGQSLSHPASPCLWTIQAYRPLLLAIHHSLFTAFIIDTSSPPIIYSGHRSAALTAGFSINGRYWVMSYVFSMWKNTRMIVLTAVCAAIYAAALIAFKTAIPLVPGITEVRVAGVFLIVFGFLFGPAGAWGLAFGNLIGDIFGGTLGAHFGSRVRGQFHAGIPRLHPLDKSGSHSQQEL
jgi:hypothetical protein